MEAKYKETGEESGQRDHLNSVVMRQMQFS